MTAIQSTRRGMGISLDAGNLDKPGDRIAGKPKMVFKAHFSRILDLPESSSEQLSCRGSSHGASGSYLPLTPHQAAADRTVGFDDIAEQPGNRQSAYNIIRAEAVVLGKIVKNRRKDTTRTTGRRGDDLPSAGVLLRYRIGICRKQGVATEIRPS